MWIKVTTGMTDERRTVLVNADHVQKIDIYDYGNSPDIARSTIYFTDGQVLNVRETVDQLWALLQPRL